MKTKKESKSNVWTFWIFICRTDISANADDSKFDMDERATFALMVMYEIWWVRYFRSERRLADFYSSFLGIPVAGAKCFSSPYKRAVETAKLITDNVEIVEELHERTITDIASYPQK